MKCETCGWKYPGFHVCIDPNKPVDPKVTRKHNPVAPKNVSPEQRRHLTSIANERWERHRDDNMNRDNRFVALYKSGLSIKDCCAQFGIAFQTGRGILYRAEMRGEVKIRPRGTNAHNKEDSYGVG